jgi:hypothetical protein
MGNNNINSNDFFDDLDIFRSPQQMRSYFELKRTEILANKEYNDLARKKTGKYKTFLEEFYPLFLFSQSKYVPTDASVRVVLGNQSFDAVIKYASGEIKKYEITEYIYGQLDHEDAVLLNKRGYSKMRIGDTRDLETKAKDYLEEVISNANNKALKNYKEVSLIIVIDTFFHLDIWELNTNEFIRNVIERIRVLPFNTEEVFLLVRNNDPVELVNNNIYRII